MSELSPHSTWNLRLALQCWSRRQTALSVAEKTEKLEWRSSCKGYEEGVREGFKTSIRPLAYSPQLSTRVLARILNVVAVVDVCTTVMIIMHCCSPKAIDHAPTGVGGAT